MSQVLRTSRLTLEPLEARHAPALFAALDAPEIYDHLDEEPPTDLEALQERYRYLERRSSPDGTESWLNWVLHLDATEEYIGYVQATVVGGSAEIAYVLSPRAWGKGLAAEATTAMCAHLAVDHAVTELTAHVAPANAPSRALLERLGFSFVRRTADGDLLFRRRLEVSG